MADQERVSLRPSTFTQGGGLIDDVDVTIARARFGFGYGQAAGSGADAVTLQISLTDSEGNEHQQYYSVGQGFTPSETGNEDSNGLYLVPTSDRKAMNGGSNAALFLNSLVMAGLPEDLLDGDINAIEGTQGHVNRVPEPKRGNLPNRGTDDRPKTVLLFSTITALPGESKLKSAASKVKTMTPVGKANGAAAPAKTAPPAKPAANKYNEEAMDEMAMTLVGVFAEKDVSSMKKVDLVKALFGAVDKTSPNRATILKYASQDDALRSIEGFSFDGSVLSQAE